MLPKFFFSIRPLRKNKFRKQPPHFEEDDETHQPSVENLPSAPAAAVRHATTSRTNISNVSVRPVQNPYCPVKISPQTSRLSDSNRDHLFVDSSYVKSDAPQNVLSPKTILQESEGLLSNTANVSPVTVSSPVVPFEVPSSGAGRTAGRAPVAEPLDLLYQTQKPKNQADTTFFAGSKFNSGTPLAYSHGFDHPRPTHQPVSADDNSISSSCLFRKGSTGYTDTPSLDAVETIFLSLITKVRDAQTEEDYKYISDFIEQLKAARRPILVAVASLIYVDHELRRYFSDVLHQTSRDFLDLLNLQCADTGASGNDSPAPLVLRASLATRDRPSALYANRSVSAGTTDGASLTAAPHTAAPNRVILGRPVSSRPTPLVPVQSGELSFSPLLFRALPRHTCSHPLTRWPMVNKIVSKQDSPVKRRFFSDVNPSRRPHFSTNEASESVASKPAVGELSLVVYSAASAHPVPGSAEPAACLGSPHRWERYSTTCGSSPGTCNIAQETPSSLLSPQDCLDFALPRQYWCTLAYLKMIGVLVAESAVDFSVNLSCRRSFTQALAHVLIEGMAFHSAVYFAEQARNAVSSFLSDPSAVLGCRTGRRSPVSLSTGSAVVVAVDLKPPGTFTRHPADRLNTDIADDFPQPRPSTPQSGTQQLNGDKKPCRYSSLQKPFPAQPGDPQRAVSAIEADVPAKGVPCFPLVASQSSVPDFGNNLQEPHRTTDAMHYPRDSKPSLETGPAEDDRVAEPPTAEFRTGPQQQRAMPGTSEINSSESGGSPEPCLDVFPVLTLPSAQRQQHEVTPPAVISAVNDPAPHAPILYVSKDSIQPIVDSGGSLARNPSQRSDRLLQPLATVLPKHSTTEPDVTVSLAPLNVDTRLQALVTGPALGSLPVSVSHKDDIFVSSFGQRPASGVEVARTGTLVQSYENNPASTILPPCSNDSEEDYNAHYQMPSLRQLSSPSMCIISRSRASATRLEVMEEFPKCMERFMFGSLFVDIAQVPDACNKLLLIFEYFADAEECVPFLLDSGITLLHAVQQCQPLFNIVANSIPLCSALLRVLERLTATAVFVAKVETSSSVSRHSGRLSISKKGTEASPHYGLLNGKGNINDRLFHRLRSGCLPRTSRARSTQNSKIPSNKKVDNDGVSRLKWIRFPRISSLRTSGHPLERRLSSVSTDLVIPHHEKAGVDISAQQTATPGKGPEAQVPSHQSKPVRKHGTTGFNFNIRPPSILHLSPSSPYQIPKSKRVGRDGSFVPAVEVCNELRELASAILPRLACSCRYHDFHVSDAHSRPSHIGIPIEALVMTTKGGRRERLVRGLLTTCNFPALVALRDAKEEVRSVIQSLKATGSLFPPASSSHLGAVAMTANNITHLTTIKLANASKAGASTKIPTPFNVQGLGCNLANPGLPNSAGYSSLELLLVLENLGLVALSNGAAATLYPSKHIVTNFLAFCRCAQCGKWCAENTVNVNPSSKRSQKPGFPSSTSGGSKKQRAAKPPYLVCTGCQMTRYCSSDCQKQDLAMHQKFCQLIRTSQQPY